jgi:F1F0 ATPase subunit 2
MMTKMLILALLSGAALGIFFFVGLWWTVRKGLVANTPAAWFLLSFLLRMTVTLSGFYWIAQTGEWQHLAIALLGFIAARIVLTRFAPSPQEKDQNQENTHAS